tara:strand:+ start:280 stop:423 length:144 start_codon:yes stop_codon:yes gene_type:complete
MPKKKKKPVTSKKKKAPPGYHYMPNGLSKQLMKDSDMKKDKKKKGKY